MESVNLANSETAMTVLWNAADLAQNRAQNRALPSLPSESLQGLLDLIHQVRAVGPKPQRALQPLALKALTALNRRANEELDLWAAQLAGDIVDAID